MSPSGHTHIVVVNGSGNRSYTHAVNPDGTFTLTVTQTDLAGNISPPTSTVFTIDTTKPITPTILTPLTGTVLTT